MSPVAFLLAGLGGAIGTMARLAIGLFATRVIGETFPWGTLAINISGSLVIGIFSALTIAGGAIEPGPNTRIFVVVGLCGGFTTFSSFSLQTVALAQQGSLDRAAFNVVASCALCLFATWLGFVMGNAINSWSHH